MTSMEDAQIELLKRQYEEDRARVWANPTIPPGMKQAEVNALWRKFDAQRAELQEALSRGEIPAGASRHPVSPITGRPMIFPRKRRRHWK